MRNIDQELIEVASIGRKDLVANAIDRGADFFAAHATKGTAFYSAIRYCCFETAALIFDACPDKDRLVRIATPSGRTVLHEIANWENRVDFAQKIVETTKNDVAYILAKDNGQRSALDIALMGNNPKCARYFLTVLERYYPDRQQLICAVLEDTTVQDKSSFNDWMNRAIKENHFGVIMLLAEYGADPNLIRPALNRMLKFANYDNKLVDVLPHIIKYGLDLSKIQLKTLDKYRELSPMAVSVISQHKLLKSSKKKPRHLENSSLSL